MISARSSSVTESNTMSAANIYCSGFLDFVEFVVGDFLVHQEQPVTVDSEFRCVEFLAP